MAKATAIVVFNGCFCPVHAGHVKALEDTKRKIEAQGKVQVVAGYFAVAPDHYVQRKVGKLEPWMTAASRVEFCKLVGQDVGWNISAAEYQGWKQCGTDMVARYHDRSTSVIGVREEARKGGVARHGMGAGKTAQLSSTGVRAELARCDCTPKVVDDYIAKGDLLPSVGTRLKQMLAISAPTDSNPSVDHGGVRAKEGPSAGQSRDKGGFPDVSLNHGHSEPIAARCYSGGEGMGKSEGDLYAQCNNKGRKGIGKKGGSLPAGRAQASGAKSAATPSYVASLLRGGRVSATPGQAGPRGQRARLAQETLQLLEACVTGSPCEARLDSKALGEATCAAVAASVLYPAHAWQPSQHGAGVAASESDGIEVWRCPVIEAAQWVAEKGGRVGVLNFASARNAGGGFLTGAEAQEESIARSSAIYPCLMKHFDSYYQANRQAKSGAYTHDIIYTPAVPVLRDAWGMLLDKPYSVDFATAAAPNCGVMVERGHKERDAEEALRERAERVLEIFARHGATHIVLGAWGCGVFKNDPSTVANIFAAHLRGRFSGRFRHVAFAILDDQMACVFERIFCNSNVDKVSGASASSGQQKCLGDGLFANSEGIIARSAAVKRMWKLEKTLREIEKLEENRRAAKSLSPTSM